MYRESLGIAIHRHNADFEVMIADPESLDGEAKRFGPHALVRDDDGTELGVPDGVVCWIAIDDHVNARISVDGQVSELYDVCVIDLLAAIDETERLLSGDGG
jgi:hypothetical protein